MLDLAHNPMADQRAEYGTETQYSQLEVVAGVFLFGGMAQVSNVLAPSTKCYALSSLVRCDKRDADLEVITLGIPLARIPTERALEVAPRVMQNQGRSWLVEMQ